MKKTMFLWVLLLSFNGLFAQAGKVEPTGGGGDPWCPPGCASTATYTITLLNFHKPRTDCKEGFGFCLRGYWSQGCNCNMFKPSTSIENGKATCVAKIEGLKMTVYIPYALKELDEYKNENTSVFTVGENQVITNSTGKELATLVPGDYLTKIEADNFVIVIDLK